MASLAVGATSGYLFAKKKYEARTEGLIALEVHKTKKYFSVLLMEAEKKADIKAALEANRRAAAVHDEPLVLEAEDPPAEPTKAQRDAEKAMVNYAGFAEKPALSTLVQSNIFTKDSPKKTLPPRDPSTGKFAPKTVEVERNPDEPYVITEEEFLLNDPENEQDSVLYFITDDTAVLTSDYTDVIDNDRIGESNLSAFPDEEPSVIYVRNEGLGIDYQITRTYDSLTAAMGLGEDDMEFHNGPEIEEDEDDDANEYALQE